MKQSSKGLASMFDYQINIVIWKAKDNIPNESTDDIDLYLIIRYVQQGQTSKLPDLNKQVIEGCWDQVGHHNS